MPSHSYIPTCDHHNGLLSTEMQLNQNEISKNENSEPNTTKTSRESAHSVLFLRKGNLHELQDTLLTNIYKCTAWIVV